ncbi:MAG TPA: PilZ domain-containing protein, partial [Polyangia bacterium]
MAKPPKPPPPPPTERRSAERVGLVTPIRIRYESVIDFVETQSMNISRTGMFIVTERPAALGSRIEFEFSLTDGFVLLSGLAEVVRVAMGGIVEGMGVRFLDLDDANRRVIERIVSVNTDEGRVSTLTFDFSRPAADADDVTVVSGDDLLEIADPDSAAPSIALPAMPPVISTGGPPKELEIEAPAARRRAPAHATPVTAPHRAPRVSPAPAPAAPAASPAPAGKAAPAAPSPPPVQFDGSALRVVLGPDTVRHFTANPLVNVRTGGLMVPAEKQVPLGTVFT